MADHTFMKRLGPGEFPVLELAGFCAMAVVALAFSAGLYVQSGVALGAATIAGVALFLVMAAAQLVLSRAFDLKRRLDRLGEIELALSKMSATSEQLREASELSLRLDEFGLRLDILDQSVSDLDRSVAEAPRLDLAEAMEGAKSGKLIDELAYLDHLDGEIKRLDARLDGLHKEFETDNAERHETIASELHVLESLVKQVAEQVAKDSDLREAVPVPAALGATLRETARIEEQTSDTSGRELRSRRQLVSGEGARADQASGEREPTYLDAALLDAIRTSIEANKIDLYLQPIVTLPERRVRFYEALTRLRDEAGEILLPKDYLELAESAGIMPLIDNVMLFRSVQVLRRLSERSSARGMFCNISAHSLLDAEFFPEFVAFMEQNQTLADSLFFEFSQSTIEHCGPVERDSLAQLSELGFRFSLDHVRNLDIDCQELQMKGFRFLKIDADIFLNRMAEAGARIHPADMRSYLDRFAIDLIIEKIEDEEDLTRVQDHQIALAQGYLFSEPRPVRPEVFGEGDAAAAA